MRERLKRNKTKAYSGDLRKKRFSYLSNMAFAWRAASFFSKMIKEQMIPKISGFATQLPWLDLVLCVFSLAYRRQQPWVASACFTTFRLFSKSFGERPALQCHQEESWGHAHTPCCGNVTKCPLCAPRQPLCDFNSIAAYSSPEIVSPRTFPFLQLIALQNIFSCFNILPWKGWKSTLPQVPIHPSLRALLGTS